MEKINKEYYEKLKNINYSKVETTLYDKLKNYKIWELKNRIEELEDHFLSYENRIEYIKKMIKKNIEKYYNDDFTIIFNEELKQYELLHGKNFFPIPIIYIYNEDNGELENIKVSYEKEDFFIHIPQRDEYSDYAYYLDPPKPNDLKYYFNRHYSYKEDKMLLENATYCYEAIEELMVVTAYILVRIQDPSWEKGLDLNSLNLPNNVGLSYIKDPKFKFKNCILDLMNRFKKDELLAFILFAFDFNYYLNKKSKEEERNLTSPVSKDLSNLSFKLLNIKDNDYVLNLYSELGNFVIESFFNSSNIKIRGIEDFYLIRNISILKASLISDDINFSDITPYDFNNALFFPIDDPSNPDYPGFYIEASDTRRIQTAFEYIPKKKVDKIFSNLSLIPDYYTKALFDSDFYYYNKETKEEATERYKKYYIANLEISKEIIKDSSLEWLSYIRLIEEQLKDDGRAISLVEKNILYNYENRNIRKFFIEKGYIEAIISLPENIMIDVSNSLVFIVFSRGSKKIRFIDASSFGKIKKFKRQHINTITDSDIEKIMTLLNSDVNNEISISKKIEEFSENNYNLDVNQNIKPSKEATNGIKFKNVIKKIMRGSQISASELKSIKAGKNDKTSYMYLSLSNVNDGIIEFENIEEYLTEIPKNQENFCIKNNSILLSKYGNLPYKFAVAQIPYDEKEEKLNVIASGNFIIIEVDEKQINPWYLGALFSSYAGTRILKKAYSGSKLLSLSIKKLEETIIPYPSMELQKEIGEKYKRMINEIEKTKKELKDKIKSTREIFDEFNMEV